MHITISKIEELIRRLKNDDKSALDEIFHYYYPRLYNFSKRILKIEDEIDDILQDVFLKIWINRNKINNPETFNSFIFTITKNALLNLIRSNINKQTFKEEFSRKVISAEYFTIDQIEFKEIQTAIDQIVSRLPEKRQKVFLLSRIEGLSNKEIAQKLNISEKTVEDHITHSIRFLKKSLSEFGILSLLYFYLFI
jgi:RNA polymerase sigma-70 factor, ECF subfamily